MMELVGLDWQQWAQQPQTKEFVRYLDECVKEHQSDWLNNTYESDNPHAWVTYNAGALATARAYAKLKQTIENLAEGETNAGNEPIRTDGDGGSGAGEAS